MGSVGVKTLNDNIYPDFIIDFQGDNLFLSGQKRTHKSYNTKDNEYFIVNKNHIEIGLYDQQENPEKSISLIGEINRINKKTYYDFSMIEKIFYKKKLFALIVRGRYRKKEGISFFTEKYNTQQFGYMKHKKNYLIKIKS